MLAKLALERLLIVFLLARRLDELTQVLVEVAATLIGELPLALVGLGVHRFGHLLAPAVHRERARDGLARAVAIERAEASTATLVFCAR